MYRLAASPGNLFLALSLHMKGLQLFLFLTKNRPTDREKARAGCGGGRRGREEIRSTSYIIKMNSSSLFYAHKNQNSYITYCLVYEKDSKKWIYTVKFSSTSLSGPVVFC